MATSADEPLSQLVAAVEAGGAPRWAALAAMARSPDAGALDALLGYAAAPDWTIRRAAVEALGRRADGGAVQSLLRDRLHDESPQVARAACAAVAALSLAALRAELLAVLRARDAGTRDAALRAIAQLWRADDASVVLAAYETDADADVRRTAAFILREKAGPEWWPTLVARWRSDPLPRHRVWACELAAAADDPAMRESVAALAADPDGHVRAAARRSQPTGR